MANSSQILQAAEVLAVQAHNFLKIHENQNKRGGYVAVLNWKRKELVLVAKVGQVNKDKVVKYEALAREKAWRLSFNSCLWTSFEGRDPEADVCVYDQSRSHHPVRIEKWGHWGGAVRGSRYIFSFSGFPELLDEALMFALAIRQNNLSVPFVLERFGGRNKYLEPFLKHCGLCD